MAGENLGADFSIDVTDLKAGLAQANRLIRESESDFKAAAAGLEDWSNEQKGLEARIKHLNTATDLQNKKVSALTQEYERLISEGMDPTDKKAIELRTSINRETEALNKNQKELEKQKDALNDLGTASEDAKSGTEDVASGFSGLKGASAIAVGAIAAVAAGAVAAVSKFLSLAESTREFRTEMAKLSQNANEADVDLSKIENKISDITSVTNDSGAAIEGLNMLMATGLDTSQIENAADAFTYASQKFDGLSFESISEAFQESLAVGEAVGGFGELIERTGGDLEAFNAGLAATTGEAEKQQYMMDWLAKSGLKELNDEYKEANKEIVDANKAMFEQEQAIAKLGDAAEPLSTKFSEMKTAMIENITPAITSIADSVLAVIDGTEGAEEQLLSTLEEIGNSIWTKFTEFTTNLLSKIGEMLPIILPKIVEILSNVINKIIEFAPQLLDAAIDLLYGLVEAIPPTISALLSNLPKIIGKIVSFFIENQGKITKTAIDLFFKLVAAIPKILPDLITGLFEIIGTIKDTLMEVDWGKLGLDIVKGIISGMKNVGSSIWEGVQDVGEAIVSGFKSFFGIHSPSTLMADEIGSNLALGIGEGFEDKIKGVNKAMVKSLNFYTKVPNNGGNTANMNELGGNGSNNGYSITQNNYYKQAVQSQKEKYIAKQALAATIRKEFAMGGV